MPMMVMLIICVFIYFISLVAILIYNKNINTKYAIIFFASVNTGLFIGYCINEFYRKGNFEFLTFDQISPFMFTMFPLSFLMNKKVQYAYYCTAAFLSFGMFVAMLVSPQEAYLANYKSDATILYVLDTLEHLNMSLFGIYLVASGIVKLNFSNLKKAMIFIYSVIIFVVIVNFLFHKNYFGMGYYSKFAIYSISLFETYWATLAAYLLGLFLVLCLGLLYNYTLVKLSAHNLKKEVTNIVFFENEEEKFGE